MNDNNIYSMPFLNPTLPLDFRVNDLISRLSLEEKIGLIPQFQSPVERLQIKEYMIGGEITHGVVSELGNATVFPQPIGLSCTWDSDLMYMIGSVIGDEARVYYKKGGEKDSLTRWGPTIDMERDPRWGRTEEGYGEDPYLTGRLSVSLIKGMQGNDPFYLKMSPAPKHFYGNNNEKDRLSCSVSIDPRNKMEYYLKAYEPAFREGNVYSMMTAYNYVNGTPCIIAPEVEKVVKQEWGCKGFIVCDGGDLTHKVGEHKYYKTYAESAANALKNGVDCIIDNAELTVKSIKEALEKELLSVEVIDNAVRNILRVRFKLGQFNPDNMNPYSNIPESILNCRKHRELALKAAQESIVLLKNENKMLPLCKDKVKRIAVIGVLADEVYRDWYTGTYEYKITPLQGIIDKVPDKEIVYKSGNDKVTFSAVCNNNYLSVDTTVNNQLKFISKTRAGEEEIFELYDWGNGIVTLKADVNNKFITIDNDKNLRASAEEIWGWYVKEAFCLNQESDRTYTLKTSYNKCVSVQENNYAKSCEDLDLGDTKKLEKNVIKNGLDEAVEAAKMSDIAIVFVGNHPLINGKEDVDRKDIDLANSQEELVKAVYSANRNTIMVVVGSYPFSIKWANENIPSILYSSHGCQELGNAIADVLFGDYSPAGRLSMTWYNSISQLPDIMNYDIVKGKRTYMYFDGKPLYPFGYGLTYADFQYSNLKLSSSTMALDEDISISVQVQNVGYIESDEVVQMYVCSCKSRVNRPLKELRGFTRIHLLPGEIKNVEFNLRSNDFSFWDVSREKYCVESGSYKIMIGRSSANLILEESITINGEVIPNRDLMENTNAENYDDYEGVILDEWEGGVTCVKCINAYGWIAFHNVDFKESITHFECLAYSLIENSNIDIRLDKVDGRRVGTCKIPSNIDDIKGLTSIKCEINEVQGVHSAYILLDKDVKIKSLRFAK